MSKADSRNMSTSRGGQDSSSESEGAGLRSAKDRECPFCHQAFTSSSLGRHLDLFIRPNHPKPPDGVHKVDEIRKIRGRITRRQPKGIGKVKANGVRQTPPESPYLVQEIKEHVAPTVEDSSRYVNAMDWRSTGVINGVDEKVTIAPDLPSRDSPSLEEQVETGKAAELALRDLVDSIKAAQTASRPKQEDDLLSLSFPGLCLTILPAPRSLFSTTPFADDSSWALGAPDHTQKLAVEKVLITKRNTEALEHLEACFKTWIGLSLEERSDIWKLEVLRFWTRSKATQDKLEAQLTYARQRIAHLESEYELLSRCQLPREKLLTAPTTIPINAELPELDAQELIQRWRSNVRTTARPKKIRRSELVPRAQPGVPTLSSDIILHGSVFGIGGPMNRSQSPPGRTEEMLRVTDNG